MTDIEEELKKLLHREDAPSAEKPPTAPPASPAPSMRQEPPASPPQPEYSAAQPPRAEPPSRSGQPSQPSRPARPIGESPTKKKARPQKHTRVWMLLWSGIGIASLVLLAVPTFAITEMPSTAYPYQRPSGINYSGYQSIGLFGSVYWPIACVMLLLLLVCAAVAVTGILRYIRKDLDVVLGHVMAGETYAYGVLLAGFCIVLKICTGRQEQSFRIWQEVQWLVVLAVAAFLMARSLNKRYGGFVPVLKPPIHINRDSKVYKAFYGKYGAWLRSLAAIGVGTAVMLLIRLFTGFSAAADAENSFMEVINLAFFLTDKANDFSFSYFVQYGFTCMLFLLLGKVVSRLTENRNAVNEKLESAVLYPGNIVLMLAIGSIASLPWISGLLDVLGLFTWFMDTFETIGNSIIIPFRYVVALLYLLFLVLWIVLICVMVCYGFVRLIKSVLVIFGGFFVFGLLFLIANSATNGALEPVVDGVANWLDANVLASKTIYVAFVVLMNDFMDSTIDRKTDERIDRLIEKVKMRWARLRAFPENRRRKREERRQARALKRMNRANS